MVLKLKNFAALVVLHFQYYMLILCNDCITTQDSSENQRGRPCVFPFIINPTTNKVFNECTTEKDPNGKLWCSTKTDDSNKHIRGNWGYCPDDCQICKTTNESGSKVALLYFRTTL